MGKKLDKKAKAAVAKAAKGVKAAKVDKAVKKFRKLEGKLWTREYLLKIAEFDGATIAPANGAAARADAMGTLAGEHHKLLTSEKSVELVRSLARETVAGGQDRRPAAARRDPRARPRPARGKRHSHRGGRGLDQAHLRGRRRVAQGQDGQ
ncbi:MAG: hypothetical protein V8Q95_06675 [Collinsella sp.]